MKLAPIKDITTKRTLISVGTNAKTVKSDKSGSIFKTAICYLAPADMVRGLQLCPMADIAGCKAACLNTAGRGQMSNVQEARIRKAELFRDNRYLFFAILLRDIAREERKAKKNGYSLAVRLNGTSDIQFEAELFEGKTVFEYFPGVTFYDYSKNYSKARAAKIAAIPNYSITLSYSEVNRGYARKIANQDTHNIAVVFRDTIPDFFTFPNGKTLPVLNGDISDERYLDATDQQYVIGLLAKGKAKQDTSGFVIDPDIIFSVAA